MNLVLSGHTLMPGSLCSPSITCKNCRPAGGNEELVDALTSVSEAGVGTVPPL